MNNNDNCDQDITDVLYEYIASFDREIYANEIHREESLIQQATNMQTAFSFVSAAVFMLAAIIMDHRGELSLKIFPVVLIIISLFLLFSLLCATLAQMRFKRKAFPEASAFQNFVEKNYKQFESKAQRAKYMADTYSILHKGLSDTNEVRVSWIQRSMRFFIGAIIMCVIGFFAVMIFQ